MTTTNKEFTTEELHQLLSNTPTVKADYNLLLIKLKRRQLTGSQQCIKATLEVLRLLVINTTLFFVIVLTNLYLAWKI
jgi:hypothetical protein